MGDGREWPADVTECLEREGYAVGRAMDLSVVPPLLAGDGSIRALFMLARPLAASDLLVLRSVRESSPRTAIVIVTRTPTQPDLKRALESGATAFLSWPASARALRQALDGGAAFPPPAARPHP